MIRPKVKKTKKRTKKNKQKTKTKTIDTRRCLNESKCKGCFWPSRLRMRDPCTFKTYLTHECLDVCLPFSRKLHLSSFLNERKQQGDIPYVSGSKENCLPILIKHYKIKVRLIECAWGSHLQNTTDKEEHSD